MARKPGNLQGTLDLLVLKTLAFRGPLHGYGIAMHVEAGSGDVLRVEEGSLYPTLHCMELAGWIRSNWRASDNNRRAKYYGITGAGSRRLADEEQNSRLIVGAVERVLKFT
jgi:transcriptional regulator